MKRDSSSRVMAVVVAVAMTVALNPAWATAGQAGLSGTILTEDARTPFSGAVVHLTGPSDEVIKSDPTGTDGTFDMTDLAPGVYRCLVSTDDGYFQVTTALRLEPGQSRSIQLALKKEDQPPISAGVGTATGGGGGSGAAAYAPLVGIGVVLLTVGLAEALSSDPKKKGSPSEPEPAD